MFFGTALVLQLDYSYFQKGKVENKKGKCNSVATKYDGPKKLPPVVMEKIIYDVMVETFKKILPCIWKSQHAYGWLAICLSPSLKVLDNIMMKTGSQVNLFIETVSGKA